MKKKVLSLVIATAVAMPVLVLVQSQPDLSGTWTFDEAKSDPASAGGGGRPGGGGGRMGGGTPSKLVITQTPAELTVETTTANGTQTAVYKLDGSESVNKTAMGESKSRATWDGANLVIAGKQAISTSQGDFEIEAKDIYSVAGTVLTVSTTRVTPRGETTRKLVFNKA
jgi:hypothetical protein